MIFNIIFIKNEAIDTAVETIRKTTAIASISWIIYTLVVLGFTILGAMTMKHTKESIAKKEIK